MPTTDHTINSAWKSIATGPADVSITSYMAKAKFATGAVVPTLDTAVAGHILPNETTVTVPVLAGESLWVHGEGHVSVNADSTA